MHEASDGDEKLVSSKNVGTRHTDSGDLGVDSGELFPFLSCTVVSMKELLDRSCNLVEVVQ